MRLVPIVLRSGLGWRLLASYLVVIAVAAIAAFTAGEAIAPYFIDRHTRHMAGIDPALVADPAMVQDLAREYRRALTQSLGWAIATAAAAMLAVGVFVTARIVTPLRAMEVASRGIASGRYRERLDEGAFGEVGALARSFNTMAVALDDGETRRRQLVGDLAHEIRTPLSNLRGYLEGLEDGVFDVDADTTSAFGRQLDRLERLMEDLSLLSRLDAGAVSLHLRRSAVAGLVGASATALRGRFEEKGVDLLVAPTVPAHALVVTDAARFAQVLENLLGNALRHTPAGGRVEVVAAASAGHVRFEVRDTGTGVPPSLGASVFVRFVRGDSSRSDGEGVGSGIGLTIAKELIERQGGEIGWEARPGGGAVFWFTLPIG